MYRGCASSSRLLDRPQQGVKGGFLEEVPSESTQMCRAESTPTTLLLLNPVLPRVWQITVRAAQCGGPLGRWLRPSRQSQALTLLSAAVSSISARRTSAFILVDFPCFCLAFFLSSWLLR